MSSPEVPETGDEVEIEVSDVRFSASAASTPSPRSPFDLRYTRRQRLVRLTAGLLALVLVVSAITGVGRRVLGLMMTPSPSPTLIPSPVSAPNFPATFPPPASSLVPAGNPFYLLPNPPGVEVSLDGHALASPPPPGDPHPLRLASGHHSLTWSSHYFPFMPMRCTISVPHASDDTCPSVPVQDLPAADANLVGHVIALHASFGTLPASDGAQLTQVIQAALDANRSHATVQSGEHYYVYQQGENGSPTTATQPLRATLSHVYLPGAGYFEPCIFTQPVIPCRFPGQDCGQICTVPQPPPDVATSPGDWIAAVIVHASWRYTTQDGRVVAQDLGEAVGLQLAVLRITWDGGGWHVTPILGATPGLPAADDLVCDPARFWLGGNGTWAFMMSDPPPGARTQFVSDSLPTDGCLAVLNPYPRGAPSAVFLQRFGVLLAVNAAATNGGSAGLPVADAAEQQVARHLAAQVGFTIP
ncbi:MAG TPA: hypothetical protein VKQ30_22885 [Ktedonobacterales bacterium]|nr:hypothetical protein [Ktedonobacterales bacterium]